MIKDYVLGIVFDPAKVHTVIINKRRPKEHFGLWNAIGGAVEEGETLLEAMVREFYEETGVLIEHSEWNSFGRFQNHPTTYRSFLFTAITRDIFCCTTKEDQHVSVIHIADLNQIPVVHPLRTFVQIAKDEAISYADLITR